MEHLSFMTTEIDTSFQYYSGFVNGKRRIGKFVSSLLPFFLFCIVLIQFEGKLVSSLEDL